jgi:hypothetical protein
MSEPPRWWTVRAAQNLKPATYRCPFCDELLPALSEHVLVTPEGDARRRRHAIRRARSPSARPAGCPRATSGCGRSRHNLARSGVFSVGSAAGAERIKTDSQLVVLTGTWAASMAPSTGPTCCRGVSARRRPSSSRPRRSSPRSTRAVDIALLDHAFGESAEQFRAGGRRYAEDLASNPGSPLGWPTSVAHALATNNADRSPRTAPTSSRDRMSASSARTAATTRADAGSSTSSRARAR